MLPGNNNTTFKLVLHKEWYVPGSILVAPEGNKMVVTHMRVKWWQRVRRWFRLSYKSVCTLENYEQKEVFV